MYRLQTSNAKFFRFVRSSGMWFWRNRFGAERRVRRRVAHQLQDGEAHTVPDLAQQLRLSSGRVQLALWDLERAGLGATSRERHGRALDCTPGVRERVAADPRSLFCTRNRACAAAPARAICADGARRELWADAEPFGLDSSPCCSGSACSGRMVLEREDEVALLPGRLRYIRRREGWPDRAVGGHGRRHVPGDPDRCFHRASFSRRPLGVGRDRRWLRAHREPSHPCVVFGRDDRRAARCGPRQI